MIIEAPHHIRYCSLEPYTCSWFKHQHLGQTLDVGYQSIHPEKQHTAENEFLAFDYVSRLGAVLHGVWFWYLKPTVSPKTSRIYCKFI